MNRREFLKNTGAVALAVAGSGPLLLLAGCGGGGVTPTPAPSPIEKIPFAGRETLEAIRAKIVHNGYIFTVDHNWLYDYYGVPGGADDSLLFLPPATQQNPLPLTDTFFGSGPPLPSIFDLRNINGHSYIGPIRNQSHTGLCYLFAACVAAEAAHNLKFGLYDENAVVLSPMYLKWTLSPMKPYNNHRDDDHHELDMLLQAGGPEGKNNFEGACREEDFPFTVNYDNVARPTPPPDFLIIKSTKVPRITYKRWASVFPNDYRDTTEQIKRAILTYGAVATTMAVNSAVRAYKSGVYEDTLTQPDTTPYCYSNAGHAIALIGWDDYPPEGGGGCWILRNSWGTGWGENGYMRIRYFSAHVNCFAAFIEAGAPSGSYQIGGTVRGAATTGVTLSMAGADKFVVITDNNGNYSLLGLADGEYTVTPSKPGFKFEPAFRKVTVNGASVAGQDFVSTKLP